MTEEKKVAQTPSGGFDLGAATPVADLEDAGTTVHVRGPDGDLLYYREVDGGDELPVTVLVAGTYSTRYRRAMDAQNTRTLKKRNVVLTGELLHANRLELIAKCVLSWNGFMNNGKELACTPENVREVMKAAPWVREQVEQTMEDHQAFFNQG